MTRGRFRARIITSTSGWKTDDQPGVHIETTLGKGFSAPQKAPVEGQGGILSAGEVCGLIQSIKTAQEVLEEMVA